MNAALKIIFIFLISLLSRNDSGGQIIAFQTKPQEIDFAAVKSKAGEAKKYCKTNKLNTNFFILADLSRHSGLKRFYVWDFKKDTIADAYMVSHGCGDNPWAMTFTKTKAKVSNVDGSHLSSVGKYVIGKRGYSNWGINVNYLLHGKDATNSNALKRQIVLHSWEKVPDEEVYPAGTPEGWGCPALSDAAMRSLDKRLRNSANTLLWVVN